MGFAPHPRMSIVHRASPVRDIWAGGPRDRRRDPGDLLRGRVVTVATLIGGVRGRNVGGARLGGAPIDRHGDVWGRSDVTRVAGTGNGPFD